MKIDVNEIYEKLSSCTVQELDKIIEESYALLGKMLAISADDIAKITTLIDDVKDEIINRG